MPPPPPPPPLQKDIVIEKVTIFVNPFAEVDKEKAEQDRLKAEAKLKKPATTAPVAATTPSEELKPQRAGVGKYMQSLQPSPSANKRAVDESDDTSAAPRPPPKKKVTPGGFGNFSSW